MIPSRSASYSLSSEQTNLVGRAGCRWVSLRNRECSSRNERVDFFADAVGLRLRLRLQWKSVVSGEAGSSESGKEIEIIELL